MLLPFGDNSNPNSLASKMRGARTAQFLSLLPKNSTNIRILDVGGVEKFWANVWDERFQRISITLLNIQPEKPSGRLPVISLAGDARDLSAFADNEFDFCFSNSVIEHVGTLSDQRLAAREIARVARGYFVQTPYRYFPLEPHFHFPFWQMLPVWLRTELHRRFNLGYMNVEKDYLTARMDVEQIRLISVRELRELFPDGSIRFERIGPFIKSLIAVREAQTISQAKTPLHTAQQVL